MTNLIASIVVTVVTNTAERLPQIIVPVKCPDAKNGGGFGCLVNHTETIPDPNPKEKMVVTTCRETTTLRFEWRGHREIVEERILWQTNQVLKLDWVSK